MLKRTIVLAQSAHLRTQQEQLVITFPDCDQSHSIPLEDVGVIVLEHYQISITVPLLLKCIERGIAIIACDGQHLPAGMLLPLSGCHHLVGERFRNQIAATAELKGKLWKQTVAAKVHNQSLLLQHLQHPHWRTVRRLSETVEPHDSSNVEAQAARLYWRQLFGTSFARNCDSSDPINTMLNYGYGVLRAATARALVLSGLFPLVGFHHHNRANSFPLADDVMEPYRPFVDAIVVELSKVVPMNTTQWSLTRDIKYELLRVLTCDVVFDSEFSPLQTALSRTAASLAQCYAGRRRRLEYPTMPFDTPEQ